VTLVANARMYAVNAEAGERWRELFAWIARRAGVALDVVDHPPPSPLRALWERDDLGAATICGYPLACWRNASHRQPVPIAAPIPAPARHAGRAVYWTDIVVRCDSRVATDDELAGTRFGWTTVDSQSGYQAPRRHFADRALGRGGRFFAATTGPLVTPRRVVESVIDGTIDAGPLDAYWHALLRRHEPEKAAQLRVVATTAPTPIPCFVASAATPQPMRERLAQAFVDAGVEPELSELRSALELAAFERVDVRAYDGLVANARDADALGYTELR
jgi:ABC-type phosphate/phosphonate transport system substrate-binding protein